MGVFGRGCIHPTGKLVTLSDISVLVQSDTTDIGAKCGILLTPILGI